MATPRELNPASAAALEDAVLRDQLNFLIRYHGIEHDADCRDCNRLALVKVILLKPFTE